MAYEYFVLSNFGVRYFMTDYTNSESIPSSVDGTNEITSVISCDLGKFNKENKKYRTLNSNGWESIAPLGQTSDDATFQCVREGQGDVYTGAAGTTTFQRIKKWFMDATKAGGTTSPKVITEIVPRGQANGSVVYEGTSYYCVPANWEPGTKDTETGQEYSFSVSPFGPQTPLVVTYVPATEQTAESFSLAKGTV